MDRPDEYRDARSRCVPFFERSARSYDRDLWGRLFRRVEVAAFASLLPEIPASSSVLDFGCGTGRQVLELAQRGLRVDAYDAAPSMRDRTARKLAALSESDRRRVRILRDESDVPERGYALVSSIGVLDFYADPALLLDRLERCMAPGGYLLVSFPDPVCPLAWVYSLGSTLVMRVPCYRHSRRTVAATTERYGLVPVAMRRSPFDRALGGMITFALFQRRLGPVPPDAAAGRAGAARGAKPAGG